MRARLVEDAVIVASIFRNSAAYIPRYLAQVDALIDVADQRIRVIVAEGDSADNSYALLRAEGLDVLKVEHHGPRFGSIRDPLRWRQIAAVCNTLMCAVVRELEPGEPFVYVESDIIWEPDVIQGLVRHIESGYDAVAPMPFVENSDLFWDTWGHVMDGTPFTNRAPYHPHLGVDLHELDSAGSCFVTSAVAAHTLQFSHVDCIRGVGRTLRENGHKLWLDPSLRVYHPES